MLFFCSSPTLATCSRLSHEFLALSSEFLWRKNSVLISSSDQLHRLFRVSILLPPSLLFSTFHLYLRSRLAESEQEASKGLPTSPVRLRSTSQSAKHPNPRSHRFLPPPNLSHLRTLLRPRPKRRSSPSQEDGHPERFSSVVASVFKHVRPLELVFIVPNDRWTLFPPRPARSASLRSNHVVVVVQELLGSLWVEGESELTSLFFGISSRLDPHSVVPKHPRSLRYVLPPSTSTDRAKLSRFLVERHRGGSTAASLVWRRDGKLHRRRG